MVELIYKYAKCSECGKEGFQWGALIENTFICHDCIVLIDKKLDDMKEEARNKAMTYRTFNMNRDTIPLSDRDETQKP
jgi:hypothetical protein